MMEACPLYQVSMPSLGLLDPQHLLLKRNPNRSTGNLMWQCQSLPLLRMKALPRPEADAAVAVPEVTSAGAGSAEEEASGVIVEATVVGIVEDIVVAIVEASVAITGAAIEVGCAVIVSLLY